ncbi:hypothetical protein HA402_014477 [Bradysia odoriphaga]|nr:hypothetical protein HA402_014477 [Bradysia odoriphaga]
MSSAISAVKDDNVIIGDGIHVTEQIQSQKALSGQQSDGETKNDEITKSAEEPVKEVNKSDPSTSAAATATVSPVRQFDEQSEETMSVPSTSTVSIEAVESPEPKPTGSADVSTKRILLKRRRSRISMPAVSAPNNVAEEVDSAPHPTKRRSQKKQMVALFLESDYPRRK